ncbi:hypothetical protein CEXT_477131 [Caerostris extrusa]|uniref:Uncharacterized protein n=1 Tax=Caerostris extrusa TaxID=172846 RepID=A0AAV4VNK3_CAEEX|nr:hypothetical protein CEXT_477131 [Caerostris extrusa]
MPCEQTTLSFGFEKAGLEEIWASPIIIIIWQLYPLPSLLNINPFALLPRAEPSSTLHVTNHVLYRGYERVKQGWAPPPQIFHCFLQK